VPTLAPLVKYYHDQRSSRNNTSNNHRPGNNPNYYINSYSNTCSSRRTGTGMGGGGAGGGGIYTGGDGGKLGNRSLVRSASGGVDTLVDSVHDEEDGFGFGFGLGDATEMGRVKCGGGNGSTESILESRCRVVSSRGSAGSSVVVEGGCCGEDEGDGDGDGDGGEEGRGEGERGERNSRAVVPGGITRKVEVLVTRS
jgi:hypothetical protein